MSTADAAYEQFIRNGSNGNWGGLPQIGFPPMGLPDFGPYILPVGVLVGLVAAGYSIPKMIDHAVIFATPEDIGWGGLVYRGFAKKVKRQKRDRFGQPIFEKDEAGNPTNRPAMETIKEVPGKLLGEIVYWPGTWVDKEGNICANDWHYDPINGLDVQDGFYYDPAKGQIKNGWRYNPNAEVGAEYEQIVPESEQGVQGDDTTEEENDWANSLRSLAYVIPRVVKYPINLLERDANIYYVGQIPILDKVPMKDIWWTERSGPKEPSVKRLATQRWNKLTKITITIDLEGLEQYGGYTWKAGFTTNWEIRNLRDAWAYAPQSWEQAASRIASGIQNFWRQRQVLKITNPIKFGNDGRPILVPLNEMQDPEIVDRDMLSKEIYYYFLRVGEVQWIRKQYGRLIVHEGFSIDNMSLEPPYDELFTQLTTSQIDAYKTVTDAVADRDGKFARAEGDKRVVDAYDSPVGKIFAFQGGVDASKENKTKSSFDDLVGATLMPEFKDALNTDVSNKKPKGTKSTGKRKSGVATKVAKAIKKSK